MIQRGVPKESRGSGSFFLLRQGNLLLDGCYFVLVILCGIQPGVSLHAHELNGFS